MVDVQLAVDGTRGRDERCADESVRCTGEVARKQSLLRASDSSHARDGTPAPCMGDALWARGRGDVAAVTSFVADDCKTISTVDATSTTRVDCAAVEQVARHVYLPEALRQMMTNAISYPRKAALAAVDSGKGVPTSR